MELNEKQQEILDEILSKKLKYVFISGDAGTGKSVLLKKLSEKYNACIVSLSAIAARNVNGRTIHSVFKLNFQGECTAKNLDFIEEMLIIDEISMVPKSIFEKINSILCKIKNKNKFFFSFEDYEEEEEFEKEEKIFGGIPVICFGDLFQLEPINNEEKKEFPVFESFLWKKFKYRELTQNMRQKDEEFIKYLKNLRKGINDIEWFNKFYKKNILINDVKNSISLVPTNYEAKIINEKLFNYVSKNKKIFTFFLKEKEVTTVSFQEYNKLKKRNIELKKIISRENKTLEEKEKFISELNENKSLINRYEKIVNFSYHLKQKNNIFLETLDICEETRLMFTNNFQAIQIDSKDINNNEFPNLKDIIFENKDMCLNGEICTVKKILAENKIIVKKEEEYFLISPVSRYFKKEETIFIKIKGFPVNYAWASTIHKMQGATIDKLIIPNTKMFANGQLYVALSRIRYPENLLLGRKIDKNDIKYNKLVDEEYKRLATMC